MHTQLIDRSHSAHTHIRQPTAKPHARHTDSSLSAHTAQFGGPIVTRHTQNGMECNASPQSVEHVVGRMLYSQQSVET